MNWRALAKLIGFFSCVVACLIGISALISVVYQEKEALWLALSALLPLLGGLTLMQFSWNADSENLSHREATLLIALSWVTAILWGAFPYYLTQSFGNLSFESFLNSLFEATAGFTATAASVLEPGTALEELSRGLLFWRSLSQWLGGLGIILMALLYLPFIRSGGMELFQTSSIVRERIRTKVGEVSKTVLFIYLTLTAVAVILLKVFGMNLFDAFCHAFSTISLGGFSTQTQNIAAYNSRPIEVILIIFMLLGSTNFALHFSFIKKDFGAYWKSSELRLYACVLMIACLLIWWNLRLNGIEVDPFSVLFNTVSIGSTTGFWSADFSSWTSFSKAVLLLLMFIGGTVGSSSGAIKCFRMTLLMKYSYREVFRIVHPAGFTPVKLEGRVVDREVLEGVAAFFFLYMVIFAVGSLILQSLGYDVTVAISGVAATLGGIGPGFGELGPSGGYMHMPMVGKVTLMFCMLLGRVEIFPILVVLSREFWRK